MLILTLRRTKASMRGRAGLVRYLYVTANQPSLTLQWTLPKPLGPFKAWQAANSSQVFLLEPCCVISGRMLYTTRHVL